MDKKIAGIDLSREDDPGFVEVVVMDYSTSETWIYRFRGDMTWEDMCEWLEKNTDFRPDQCEWMIGQPNEKLHVYQAIGFPITKDTKYNSSHSVMR